MLFATGKKLRCVFVAAVLLAQPLAGFAEEIDGWSPYTPFARSTLELRGNFGRIDTDRAEAFGDLNDIDTAHAALGYWFNINRNFSIGASYLDGESDDFDFTFFGLFDDTVLEYNAAIVGVEGRVPLGDKNSLFARLGAAFYDYDVGDRSGRLGSDSGTDVHFAAGWSRSWESGVGMEVMYEFLRMGSAVELQTVGAGITYSF